MSLQSTCLIAAHVLKIVPIAVIQGSIYHSINSVIWSMLTLDLRVRAYVDTIQAAQAVRISSSHGRVQSIRYRLHSDTTAIPPSIQQLQVALEQSIHLVVVSYRDVLTMLVRTHPLDSDADDAEVVSALTARLKAIS